MVIDCTDFNKKVTKASKRKSKRRKSKGMIEYFNFYSI